MPKKLIIKILLFIVLLCSIFLACYFYIEYAIKTTKVYVASYDLSARTCIKEEDIEEIKVPSSYLVDEVVLDKEDIIGTYVKNNSFIPKGSFFYESAIEKSSDIKDGLIVELEEGEVSYDLNTNDISVNQAYLDEGMYGDIYLTINRDRILSDLLINNVRIIGLYDSNHNKIKDYDTSTILQTISLAVPLEAVPYLNKATVVGELSLSIGNNAYNDVKSVLNKDSIIFEYLD